MQVDDQTLPILNTNEGSNKNIVSNTNNSNTFWMSNVNLLYFGNTGDSDNQNYTTSISKYDNEVTWNVNYVYTRIDTNNDDNEQLIILINDNINV